MTSHQEYADQLITLRVFEDTTPLSSDSGVGSCDDQIVGYDGTIEPGPELAGSVLLGEDETFIPIGVDPAVGPRLDGDFSVEYTGAQGGGILIEPDIAIYVVVAHAGEALVQFGNNTAGQVGDGGGAGATGGPEQSWIRPFNCSVGGSLCTQTGDWVKANLYYGANQDHVLQIHLDAGDTRNPPLLPFDCRQDIGPPGGDESSAVIGEIVFGEQVGEEFDGAIEWVTVRNLLKTLNLSRILCAAERPEPDDQ